jgi:hypothetical protein
MIFPHLPFQAQPSTCRRPACPWAVVEISQYSRMSRQEDNNDWLTLRSHQEQVEVHRYNYSKANGFGTELSVSQQTLAHVVP